MSLLSIINVASDLLNGISRLASFMTVSTETQTLVGADISQMEMRRGCGEESRIHDVSGKNTWKMLVKKT